MSRVALTASGSLRELAFGARLGLSALCLVLLGGFAASLAHLVAQHENRDERPGVSLTDLEGAYHGVDAVAPLLAALRAGHPQELADTERGVLLRWLEGKRVSEDYDSLELGDAAPAEILSKACTSCHSRAGLEGAHADAKLALATWADVSKVAFSRRIEPLPSKVLAASTHAHALALGTLSLAVAFLTLATRFGPRLGGALCAVAGCALFADLGAWWLAREIAGLAPVLVAAGAAYSLATVLSIALVLADLWLPRRA